MAMLTALITFLVIGAASEAHVGIQFQGGRPCDPFSENPGVQCEDAGTHLVQRNMAKLLHEAAGDLAGNASATVNASAAANESTLVDLAIAAKAPHCHDGHVLLGLAPLDCPKQADLPGCKAVGAGELCEGDGECGTDNRLNNCGVWDVYRKVVFLGRIDRDENSTVGSNEKATKKEQGSKYSMVKEAITADKHEEILAQNGQFLGLSRDCWIVMGLILAGFTVVGIAIVVSVSLATAWRSKIVGYEIEYEEDQETIRAPSFPVGFLQRVVFRHDLNDAFAYRADLALRVAIACAICALTYWVPCLGFMNDKGWTMQYVVVIICFTVYMDLGQTVSLAWANFYGTILPTVNIILLYNQFEHGIALQPGQQTGDTLFTAAWWFGVVDFIVFNAAFLVLNVPVGVRMFALSWQAYFSMAFLNPNEDTRFSRGFDDVILEGNAVGPLVGTIFGCVIAVMVLVTSPVGYCFTGLGQAQETAIAVALEIGEEWKRTIEYYTGCDKSLEIDKIVGEARIVQDMLDKLGSQLSCTWWETFDVGRPGRVKAHLEALKIRLDFMNDWSAGVLEALKKEDFDKKHELLMAQVREPMENLCKLSTTLLYRVTQAALAGFSPSSASASEAPQVRAMAEQLKQDIAAVNGAQRELASVFVAARRQVYEKDTLTEDALSEHFFGFALSCVATYTVEYAEYLLSDVVAGREQVGVFKASWRGLFGTLNMNSTPFILRSCLAFFGAWVFGYWGLEGVMAPFSSTAAGTTAYLMAAEGKGGSALLKNVARFQGTAGGTILGQLLFCTLIACTAAGTVLGFLVVTIFEFFAMYLYYSSESYGYVGLLLGAYGACNLVASCDNNLTAATVYTTILNQTIAIIWVCLADLIVQNESAGTLASDHNHATSQTLIKALSTLFGVDKLVTRVGFGMSEELDSWLSSGGAKMLMDMRRLAVKGPKGMDLDYVKDLSHRDELLASHTKAKDCGNEAPLEPRFFRLPFQEELWKGVMGTVTHMSTETVIMEYAVHQCAQGGKDPGHTIKAINGSQLLKDKATMIVKRAHTILTVARAILQRESLTQANILDREMIRRMNKMDFLTLDDQMEEILDEIVKDLPLPTEYSVDSLVHEDYCLVAVTLLMLSSVAERINKVENHCFKTKFVDLLED